LDAEAMNNPSVWSLGEDINGNLWVGAPAGAIRIARGGFAAYGEKDGLGARRVSRVIEARKGEIVAFTYYGDNSFVATFDGRRFISRRFNRPELAAAAAPHIHQDRKGDWWLSSQNKLYRFPKVNSASDLIDARPLVEVGSLDGVIAGFYEDRRGDFWLIMPSHPKHQVVRWERATGAFHPLSGADGLSPDDTVKPGAFVEDAEGNIWIGYISGEIGRFRNGRFELISSVTGTLGGKIIQLLRDSAGRIWIAGEKYGLRRVDNPTADRSQLIVQSFTGKLSSNLVYCIEEEAPDRFYINNINPDTRYVVKVQGCNRSFLGRSSCTPWYVDSFDTRSELHHGPDTCKNGFVWREARPGDNVCVTPQTRSQTAADNRMAAFRRSPNGGPYGPSTCKQGYVWREAFPGDLVCVP